MSVKWPKVPAEPIPTTSIDTSVPSTARMYDYFLGGKSNYAADREAGDRVIAASPEVRQTVLHNRAFLDRAVTFLAGDVGIRNFIDIGAGLPTQGNVHEVAQAVEPGAHVIYIDNDPIVQAHGRALLAENDHTRVIAGDVRDPDAILEDPHVAAMLAPGEPVALLLLAVLHFVSDEEDPYGVMARLRDALPPGSHLVLSHVSPWKRPDIAADAADNWKRASASLHLRDADEILRFFDGFELLDPGQLVPVQQWRTDAPEPPDNGVLLSGVGRLA